MHYYSTVLALYYHKLVKSHTFKQLPR